MSINVKGLQLKLYEGGGHEFSYPSKAYGRAIEYGSPRDILIGEYEDNEAWRIWWQRLFDRLHDNQKSIVLAAYPDLLQRNVGNFRHPDKIINSIATILKNAGLLKTCPRCGGSGEYSYNQRDGTRCFKCGGFKAVYPRITKAFLTTVSTHFAERLKAKESAAHAE